MATTLTGSPKIPQPIDRVIPVLKPNWGLEDKTRDVSAEREKLKATWLGHACFLVELPPRSPSLSRGARILFDPVFSDRCSPSQWVGPKRFTGAHNIL